jgi:hypothetical protein
MTAQETFPVAYRLGVEAAAKGPNRKTDFPTSFSSWSEDRQLTWHSGFQAGMREWPIAASDEGGAIS